MTATVTGGTTATGGTAPAGRAAGPGAPSPGHARRRRIRRPRASTTPGKVRLIRAGLVILCLGWGALAALMVGQHASAAANVVSTSEPLSLKAQQMYQSLAGADVIVSTGYLYGATPPPESRQRYLQDIAVATADLKAVTAASGSGDSAVSDSLSTLSADLPVYTGYVEDGQIYNSLGYPAGGSFIEVASEEMHLTLLPAARDVYAQENARLARASAQATGLPLAAITLAAALVIGLFLYRSQRWRSRRTHRTLNGGLLLASAAGVAALVWVVVALTGGRADLLQATGHGSGPAETLAQADIAALQARGDETLNLISRTGDSDFQQDFRVAQGEFSTLLTAASTRSTTDAAGPTTAASHDASSWFAVNQRAQQLDRAFDYGAETQLELGSAGTLFDRLESDLNAAIHADQAVFASSAAAGSGTFTGLQAGVIVLALAMAAGCALGLSRRLAEYR